MRVRFRTWLVSLIVAFVALTVAWVAVPAYRSGRAVADDLAGQVVDQATERVDREVAALLGVASSESALLSMRMDAGLVGHADCAPLVEEFLRVMSVRTQLSYLSYTRDVDGLHCEVMRPRGEAPVVRVLAPVDGDFVLTDYRPEPGGWVQLAQQTGKSANDGRQRAWYRDAVLARRPIWTETYVFLGEGGGLDVPGVTCATPRFAADGATEGVLTADFDLYALSRFLGELQILDGGAAFLVEYRADGTRRVVAHPDPALLTQPVADGGRDLVVAEQLSDERVRGFLGGISAEGLHRVDARGRFAFTAGGARHLATWRRLGAATPLPWVIGTVVPEDDVLGPVREGMREQLVFSALSLIVYVALALWTAAAIARPLARIADQTEEIGAFRLDPRPVATSPIVEVARLNAALEQMKAGLRSFRKYVPADLVRALLASGAEARLGGRRAVLTVSFSDLQGFTSLSEQLPPETLVGLLGEYLSAMTQEVIAGGGTVDKYIGDAIMAFWGAPNPVPDHALAACRTALANQRRLARLGEAWASRGLPTLVARFGINTGEVIVGNLGSDDRLDYTVIGDAVNLASRLEGLNKEYGTAILMGPSTFAAVAGRVVARPVDRVAVKGRSGDFRVYELLALVEDGDAGAAERASRYEQALDAYLGRDFVGAGAHLDALLERWPGDLPARRLRTRCRAFAESPPDAAWDGVFRMDSK